jgi:uncharacterized protein (TIGR02996 family)
VDAPATLISATRALEVGDDALALRLLVSLWDEHRDPMLAEAIVRLTPEEECPHLLALSPAGFDALEPSPVVARGLLALLEWRPREPSETFWQAVARALPIHAHAGVSEALALALARVPVPGRDNIIRRLRRIGAPPPLELWAITALLDRRDRARADAARPGDDLLAAIRAAPDDDAPRAVYADWLLERGDPLGELIAIQLARHASGGRPSRAETALLVRLRRRVLGRLAQAVGPAGLRIERGFLTACRAVVGVPLRDAGEWATVEDLAIENDGPDQLPDHLPALRRLSGISTSLATVLARRWPYLVHLGAELAPLAFERAAALPALHSLDIEGRLYNVTPSSLRWLWATPIGSQLDELALGTGPQSLAAWLAEDAEQRMPVRTLVIWSVRWNGSGPGWQLALHRDEYGALSRLVAWRGAGTIGGDNRHPVDELCNALDHVPRGALRSIELQPSRWLSLSRARRARLGALGHRLGLTALVWP